MRILVLSLLLSSAATAACPPPDLGELWKRMVAGERPVDRQLVLRAADPKADRAAIERGLRQRLVQAGARVDALTWKGSELHLTAALGAVKLGPLLIPGRLTVHAVDEAGMEAARAKLPGVEWDRGPVGDDRAKLEAALPTVPGRTWAIQTLTALRERPRHRAFLIEPAALDADDIEPCSAEVQEMPAHLAAALSLTAAGAKAFEALTRRQVKKRAVIALDGEVLSAPMVMEPIPGGRLFISGDSSAMAERLVRLIRGGTLPTALELVSEGLPAKTPAKPD